MSSTKIFFNYALLMLAVIMFLYLIAYYFTIATWSWYIVPVVLFAWFSADFVLGVTHLYLDYVGCPKGIGLKALIQHPDRSSPAYFELKREVMSHLGFIQKVAYDFKTHHLHPNALGTRSFSVLVAEPVMTHVLPLFSVLLIVIYFYQINELVLLYFIIVGTGFLFGQYAHANTHKDKIPLLVQWLQSMRILLTVKRHDLHHEKFDRSFCILNGWADFVIDFFVAFMLRRGWLHTENLELS